MSDRKELVLRLPEDIFEVIKVYKGKTGVSYTNFIYNAIVWYCVRQGLISLDYLKVSKERKVKKTKQPTAEELAQIEANKFCDGPTCEIDYSKKEKC